MDSGTKLGHYTILSAFIERSLQECVNRLVVGVFLLAFIGTPAILGQSLSYMEWFPKAVPLGRSEDVIFTAKVSGSPSRVVLELNKNAAPFSQPGIDLEMADDGLGADGTAGDDVWVANY